MVPMKSTVAVMIYALAIPFCACLGTHVLVHCFEKGGHHLSRLLAMMGIELDKKRNF